jgi:hypothetical protein
LEDGLSFSGLFTGSINESAIVFDGTQIDPSQATINTGKPYNSYGFGPSFVLVLK